MGQQDLKILRKLSSSIMYLGIFNFGMFFVASFIFYNFLDDLTGRFPLYISNLAIFLFLYFILDLLIHINFVAVYNVVARNLQLLAFSTLFILYCFVFRYSLSTSFVGYTRVKLLSYGVFGSSSTILFGLTLHWIGKYLDNYPSLGKLQRLGGYHIITGVFLILFGFNLSILPNEVSYIVYIFGLIKIFILPLVTGFYFMKIGNTLRKEANMLDDTIPVIDKYSILQI